jgi:hypothetical protein
VQEPCDTVPGALDEAADEAGIGVVVERDREQHDRDADSDGTEERERRQQRVGLAGGGQEPRGRDREDDVGEDVPDGRRGGADGHLLDREAPAPEHGIRNRDADGITAREHACGGRRGLRHHERVEEGEVRQRGHPGWPECREVDGRGDEERDDAAVAERRERVPDVAVVGHARQHEGEDAHDECEREGASRVGPHARAGDPGHAATIARQSAAMRCSKRPFGCTR